MAGALQGLRVLDFTTLYPGPLATMLLADLGAEVLRLEAPDRPDLLRFSPPYDRDGGSALYRMVNRNKRSMVIDLKAPEAREIIERLAADADVLVEQFRPGVMARLGLGPERLRALHPRLIYCSISGYGQDGPLRDRPGHDLNFVALCGLSHHLGRPGSGPIPINALIGDVAGGTWGAVAGILAALVARASSRVGQVVDISMTDGALLMNAMAAMEALTSGRDLQAGDGWLNGGSTYDYYRTADGRYLAVGALEPKFFAAFVVALGRPELSGRQVPPGQAGTRLKQEIAAVIAAEPLAHWKAVFADIPCCVEPVLTPTEAVDHELFAARGMVVEVPRPDGTLARQIGNPIKLGAHPAQYRHIAREPGADTDALLSAAGYSAEAIAELRAAKVVS